MPYSEKQKTDIINTICNEIEEGRSLRSVLKDEGMPGRNTFFEWIDADQIKANQYARAMEFRQDKLFEEILEIADTPEEGVKKKETEKGVEIMTGDMIEHRRLQVDSRKWMLGKMNPKKYGEASLLKLADNEGNKLEVSKYTDEELEVKLKQIAKGK